MAPTLIVNSVKYWAAVTQRPSLFSRIYFLFPTALLLSTSVATLRSTFFSTLSNCVAVYPERSEGSHSCTFGNSIEQLRTYNIKLKTVSVHIFTCFQLIDHCLKVSLVLSISNGQSFISILQGCFIISIG